MVALLAVAAAAQQTILNPSLERARAALARGDLAETERSLAAVDSDAVDINDLDFLKGTLAAAKRDYDQAILYFRRLLDRDSSLNRVRLDLARVYFEKGDDAAAEFHFRAALAQGVPAEVQPKIFSYLDQIRRRKKLDIAVSITLAPDTNINAATTAQSVNLFGLPFELDPAARRKSGTGLALGVAATRQWDVADDVKFKAGASYYGMEYADSDFSDRTVNALAGYRVIAKQGTEYSILAIGSRRWYGDKPLDYAYGARTEGQTELSPRVLLGGNLSVQHFEYRSPAFDGYTGPVYAGSTSLAYVLDAVSLLRGNLGAAYERADMRALRNTQLFAGAGYYREGLPQAFALHADIQLTRIKYRAALPAFGVVRHDTEVNYRLGVSNKRIDIAGFTPVISWVHTDRYSNIGLYRFHRDRGEIGIVRNF